MASSSKSTFHLHSRTNSRRGLLIFEKPYVEDNYGRHARKSNGQYDAYDIRKQSFQIQDTAEPVGQLLQIGERGEIKWRFCSGFNIMQTKYFLTAGHCVSASHEQPVCYKFDFSSPVPTGGTVVNFGYELTSSPYLYGASVYPCDKRISCDPRMEDMRYVTEGKYSFVQRVISHGYCDVDQLDYGILKLDATSGQFGSFELSNERVMQGQEVELYHHPEGRPKKVSDGVVLGPIDQNTFKHSAHTAGGSSGCPVVSKKTGEVIGVHISGNRDDQDRNAALYSSSIITSSHKSQEEWVSGYLSKFGLFKQSSPSQYTEEQRSVPIYTVQKRNSGGCC